MVTFAEAIPVHSDINNLRFGYSHFYSLCRVKGRDNGHTLALTLRKGGVLVTDAFGTVGRGRG